MYNMMSHDPFQYTRITVWVSPSGESQLLDEVFCDSEECVEALLNGGVFKEGCLPEEGDTPKTVAATFENLDMFD
jgi:hypothetical protein